MSKVMISTEISAKTNGQLSEMHLQRQWPQLGRELFTLESSHSASHERYHPPQLEQEENERKGKVRSLILAQLLTPMYNCAQIKLTVPRDGCSLWEMPFIIST